MNELERLAAAMLAQWRDEGGGDRELLAVSAVLDRVMPYRVARRALGIDNSEDYEALMLRLLAEEGGLVTVTPGDAAELAKATSTSKLPDLDVLQLLRAASITFSERTINDLGAATPVKSAKGKSAWAPKAAPEPAPEPAAPPPVAAPTPVVAETSAATSGCWSCSEALPVDRQVKFCPFCGADQRQPTCSACGAAAERGWKHCAECGVKL